MATERQLQFRVGMLVITAISVCLGLVVRFGNTWYVLKQRYPITIHLENSAGLYPTAPVSLSGLTVGTVKQIELDQRHGGVNVQVEIQEEIRLPADSRAMVTRSLMGEATMEFVRGSDEEKLRPGSRINGIAVADPLVMIQRLEARTVETLSAFNDTGREWQLVAKNLNSLMDTKQGSLDQVVERAADALNVFTKSMKQINQMVDAANSIVADPANQQAVKETVTALPRLVNSTRSAIDETRQTVVSARQVLDNMNRNLVNLSQVTEPVGRRGEQMVDKLDSSLSNIDLLLTELNRFARVINQNDGSLQKFVANPALYDNLERSSQSIAVLMKNMEPVMRDLREFSDKVARNPELLGVGGAVRPSTGLKDQEMLNSRRPGSPAPAVARGKSPN